jgi:hypothetical protein
MTALVQSVSNTSATSVTTTATLVLTFGATVTSGNAVALAFGYVSVSGTASITSILDDQGNSYTTDQNFLDAFSGSNAACAHVFNVTNGAKVITITIGNTTSTTINIAGTAYEVAGALSVDVSANSASASSKTLNIAFTSAQAYEFCFVADLLSINPLPSFAMNTGWTQDLSDVPTSLCTFHNVVAAAGANALNATLTPATHKSWGIVTLQPAAPTAPIAWVT